MSRNSAILRPPSRTVRVRSSKNTTLCAWEPHSENRREWSTAAVTDGGVAVLLGFYKLRPNLRQKSAMSFANNELSTTQPLWRVPLTRILVPILSALPVELQPDSSLPYSRLAPATRLWWAPTPRPGVVQFHASQPPGSTSCPW